MNRIALAVLLPLLASACVFPNQSGHDPIDLGKRKQLLDSVKALAGTWEMKNAKGEVQVTEFKVSSGGSIVRETMFPGGPEEMTNIYRLEGNDLALTHYCAMGNQPELRATSLIGNQLVFVGLGAADKKSADEMWMGGLTLEFTDKDHMTEHWSSFVKHEMQKDGSVSMAFTRRK